MSRTATSMSEQVSLWYNGVSFGYMPKNGIVRSWGELIPIFRSNCHTDFHGGCTSLYPIRNRWVLPLIHMLPSIVLLILSVLTGIRWNLNVLLIYISLMAKDAKHFLNVSQLLAFLLLKILWLGLYPIFNWIIWVLDILASWVLYIFWISALSQTRS